jgi:GTP cyclohydrolase II
MLYKAERGLFELRQGRVLCVTSEESPACTLVAAVEGLGAERLQQLQSVGGQLRLILTHHRAQAMGLGRHAGGSPDLSLRLAEEVTPEALMQLAAAPGDMTAVRALWLDLRPATAAESAGLALARLGRLLPAVVAVPTDRMRPQVEQWLSSGTVLDVASEDVRTVLAEGGIKVTHVTEAPVPLADAEHSRFVFFREGGGFLEHVAVLIGQRETWPDPVPVRLHSACLTGDLFSSLRCDCGEQLRGALRHFAARGGGVLVYLAQEGRGIGLGNKIRAYTLQEEGLDTIDADEMLGFGADERHYDAAVAILRHLGIERAQLLTNNPEKVRALTEGGIEVVDRVPLHGGINRHNLRYVQAKVDRSGHWLRDMLAQRASGE